MDIWEETEAKVNSDNDVPVNNSSNKVGFSIFKLNCWLIVCDKFDICISGSHINLERTLESSTTTRG